MLATQKYEMVARYGIFCLYYEAPKLIRCEMTRKRNIIISVYGTMKAFQIKLLFWETQKMEI